MSEFIQTTNIHTNNVLCTRLWQAGKRYVDHTHASLVVHPSPPFQHLRLRELLPLQSIGTAGHKKACRHMPYYWVSIWGQWECI